MPLTRKRDACIIFLRDGIGYINNSAAVFLHFCLGRGAAYLRRSQSSASISKVFSESHTECSTNLKGCTTLGKVELSACGTAVEGKGAVVRVGEIAPPKVERHIVSKV